MDVMANNLCNDRNSDNVNTNDSNIKEYNKYNWGMNKRLDKKINDLIIDITNGTFKIEEIEYSNQKEEESITIAIDDSNNIKVKEVIYKKLPKHKYMKSFGTYKKFNSDVSDVTCPICLDDIKNNEYVRELKCNHIFHKKCIDTWLYKSEQNVCPYCKNNCKIN